MRLLKISVVFVVGLIAGLWIGSRRSGESPLSLPALTLPIPPIPTIPSFLNDQSPLKVEVLGQVDLSSRTVALNVYLHSPDLAADNALEARGEITGPWQTPTLRVTSLKKKKFKARIGL